MIKTKLPLNEANMDLSKPSWASLKLPVDEIQHSNLLNDRLNLLFECLMRRVMLNIVIPVIGVCELHNEGVG